MKRALVLLASLLFSVALLELGLTAFYTGIGSRGPLEIAPDWRSPFVFLRKAKGAANAYSMRRSRAMSERAPAGTLRILSYGDSIAEGYGLAEEESYAYLLEERLNAAAGAPTEVLNMVRGHSPSIYSFHVRSDVPRYAPDAVLLQIELSNDVSDEAHARTSDLDEHGLPRRIRRHRYILGWDGHLLAPISSSGSFHERTKLYAKITRWYGRLRDRLSPNPLFEANSNTFFYSSKADRYLLTPEELDAGFDRLFEAVAGIQHYLDQRGVRFLLLILPSRYAFTDERFSESAREIVIRAETRARDLGIPFIAPVEALSARGGPDLFMDFCHPTAAGNLAIARELENAVAQW
jgi:lysophospholipase L1-like esterase